MTPQDFTHDLLIGWGGADCFNQALSIARRGAVTTAAWDDVDHVITGKIATSPGWEMPVRFEALDDGTIISHCPCRTNKELGQVCPHVVALGLYLMITMAPEDDAEAGADKGERDDVPEEVAAQDDDVLRRLAPMRPAIHAHLSGSRASLSIAVEAHYGNKVYECCELGPADEIVADDPDDPHLFYVRNLAAESAALELVKRYGFERGYRKETADKLFTTDARNVLNFLGSGVPYLRRHGWRMRFSPRLEQMTDAMPMIVPVVQVKDAPRGAFDVGYTFDAAGHEVPPAIIQAALNRGDSYILTNGQTLLLDTEAVDAMRDVFSDCATQGGAAPGHFRVPGIYAPYVKAALDSLDAIDVEDDEAPDWRATALARNRDGSARNHCGRRLQKGRLH